MSRYEKSESLLKRAEKTIPLGAQTFSKSKTQFPHGAAPFFIEKGMGSRVWDADANEYIDYMNGLLAVSLGYNDPDVNHAVTQQLNNGVTFSLSHRLEMEVAERIVDMVPCAEKVRFGKNGSDATSGAIRIARAYTGRDHVAVSGYHGWQDWYIGSTARNLGVPQATRELTHGFGYNDIASLENLFDDYPNQIAAVILEPMNRFYPKDDFLENVQKLAKSHGAVLVFDEMITGFRFANGGAQELFGVTPDLATFGKGMANGFPISAVAGRADIMALMEEVFFSFTFGGETLSLAAAGAVLDKLSNTPVVDQLASQGSKITHGLNQLIPKHGLQQTFSTDGHPSWSFLCIAPGENEWLIKTLLMQEMLARGILSIGTHNMSYAHTDADIEQTLGAYDEVLSLIANALQQGDINKALKTPPLQPLFRVR